MKEIEAEDIEDLMKEISAEVEQKKLEVDAKRVEITEKIEEI